MRKDDFPEPDTPVKTTRLLRGMVKSIFFRLCSCAPFIIIAVFKFHLIISQIFLYLTNCQIKNRENDILVVPLATHFYRYCEFYSCQIKDEKWLTRTSTFREKGKNDVLVVPLTTIFYRYCEFYSYQIKDEKWLTRTSTFGKKVVDEDVNLPRGKKWLTRTSNLRLHINICSGYS